MTCWFRFLLSDFRRFSASYQKSFQLSLSVLVCYRCLVLIFSLGRSSSPVFRFYFQRILLIRRLPIKSLWEVTGLSPYLALRRDVPFQAQTFFPLAFRQPTLTLQLQTKVRIQGWAFLLSLAATKRISFDFFSSTY